MKKLKDLNELCFCMQPEALSERNAVGTAIVSTEHKLRT